MNLKDCKDPSKWQLRDGSEVLGVYEAAEDRILIVYQTKNGAKVMFTDTKGYFFCDGKPPSDSDIIPKKRRVKKYLFSRWPFRDEDQAWASCYGSREEAESGHAYYKKENTCMSKIIEVEFEEE